MPISLVELARKAAAAARADGRATREAPVLPSTRYRGVHQRRTRYSAILWHPLLQKNIRLGAYATAVEAAYAYDAAARSVLGRRARPNFPELSPAPAATAREVAAVDLAASRRAPEPPRQQQPVRRHKALLIRCWAPAPADVAAQQPELPHMPAMAVELDQSVVGDNFTDSYAA